MMGGAWFEEFFGDPDQCDPDHIAKVAVEETKQQLNITEEPVRVISTVHKVSQNIECIEAILYCYTAVQCQMTVSDYITSKQILSLGFAEQYRPVHIDYTVSTIV